ncbi:MAG TPA: PQQ-dependent sugar dehydrogenase [Gaiellaceae bacterium]|nr:PQQ-dependent sugar dehydrogenase [Gaiellaceae bacterium]
MRSNWFAVVLVGAVVVLALAGAPGRASSSSAPLPRPFLGNPAPAAAPAAPVLPAGFQDTVAFSGLTQPTNLRFAPDGKIFVAEKGGLVKVFDSLSDTTPTTVVDLHTEVDDYWDRGLLGLALDPQFATNHYLYLLYTYDAPPNGTAPVWNDACPSPPGPTSDGCVASGKLVRVQLDPSETSVVATKTLISNEWCQQFPSHSIGDLQFGPDGDLYATGGDGASFTFADYGQNGGSAGSPTPKNPCGDPPAGVGGTQTPPTAEGGALRSQSSRRSDGPALLNGALLRLDPATGAAAAGNPNAGSADKNQARIVAYGMRNPFRFAFRPGTSELWVGDVGWDTWEEINRRIVPTGPVQNFGWPCYEGPAAQPGYQNAGLNLCTSLYSAASATAPFYSYNHGSGVVNGDGCPTSNGSVVSGIGFYGDGRYPAPYHGALIFADHSRNCLWAMPPGTNGVPDPSRVQVLDSGAANPVDIETGPNGDLYYVDFDGGTIHQITYSAGITCADNTFAAQYFDNTTLSGSPALTRCENSVDYDWGSGSPGPGVNADGFSARWTGHFAVAAGSYTFTSTSDDGIRVYVDGALLIDDWHDQSATTTKATTTLSGGTHVITVEYYENTGTAEAHVSWHAAPPPLAVIDTPAPTLTYAVGDPIAFSGHATDATGKALPAAALSWTLLIHHCTTQGCHVHDVQSWSGSAGGTLSAPDHDYPSHLELVLTATDSFGATGTTSVSLQPKTVGLTFGTSPSGLSLTVGSSSDTAPFTRTVIVNSANSVSAPATEQLGGVTYDFAGWSDGGAGTHNITAPAGAATYTATYVPVTAPPPPVLPPLSTHAPSLSGTARVGGVLAVDAGSWSGSSPLALTYAWLRCTKTCQVVPGAGGARYRVSAADIGSRIEARVTATNPIGSATVHTNPSPVVPRVVRGRIHALRRVPAPPRPRVHSR